MRIQKKVLRYLNATACPYKIHKNLLNREIIQIRGFTFIPGSIATGKTLVIDPTGARLPIHESSVIAAIRFVLPQFNPGDLYTIKKETNYFKNIFFTRQLIST